MSNLFTIPLSCCGYLHEAEVDLADVASRRLHARRQTVDCPGCSRIVILSLAAHEKGLVVEDQEVIDLPVFEND